MPGIMFFTEGRPEMKGLQKKGTQGCQNADQLPVHSSCFRWWLAKCSRSGSEVSKPGRGALSQAHRGLLQRAPASAAASLHTHWEKAVARALAGREHEGKSAAPPTHGQVRARLLIARRVAGPGNGRAAAQRNAFGCLG